MEVTIKRHIKQMNAKERNFLNNKIRPDMIKNFNIDKALTYHSYSRFQSKFPVPLTKEEITETIITGDFIEYKKIYENNILIDKRIVLRKNMKNDSDYDLVLVYSLMKNKIITVWDNHKDDLHRTLNLNKYSRTPIC